MKRNQYHVQNGCHNCKHVFIKFEYDDHNSYYCTLDAEKRPLCGSVAMDEACIRDPVTLQPTSRLERKLAYNDWYDWAKNKEVDVCGTCTAYEHK